MLISPNPVSAGLLLFRRQPALEIYIGHMGGPFWEQKDRGAWSIPKGLVEGRESLLLAAQREFTEETGYTPEGTPISMGHITMKSGKQVHIWTVEVPNDTEFTLKSNLFEIEWPPKSGKFQWFPEMDRGGWFSIDEAKEKLIAAQHVFCDRLAAIKF